MWKPLPKVTDSELRGFQRNFAKKARFIVDEGLGPYVALLVQEAGWNVKFAGDVGLAGHSDEDIFAYGWRENRIILTHDSHFLDDKRFPPHRNPGIIVLPGGSGNEQVVISALSLAVFYVGSYREFFRHTKLRFAEDDTLVMTGFKKIMESMFISGFDSERMVNYLNGRIKYPK
jgi:predicted nuclease of predicted toxin-antitoxin system